MGDWIGAQKSCQYEYGADLAKISKDQLEKLRNEAQCSNSFHIGARQAETSWPYDEQGEVYWDKDGTIVDRSIFDVYTDDYGGQNEDCIMMGWSSSYDQTFHDEPCEAHHLPYICSAAPGDSEVQVYYGGIPAADTGTWWDDDENNPFRIANFHGIFIVLTIIWGIYYHRKRFAQARIRNQARAGGNNSLPNPATIGGRTQIAAPNPADTIVATQATRTDLPMATATAIAMPPVATPWYEQTASTTTTTTTTTPTTNTATTSPP